MIYERPDVRQSKAKDSPENLSALPQQSVFSYDVNDLPIYFPTSVNRRKIKKTMRLAKKSLRTTKGSFIGPVLTVCLSVFVCCFLVYLSSNGIYPPDSFSNMCAQVVSRIYQTQFVTSNNEPPVENTNATQTVSDSDTDFSIPADIGDNIEFIDTQSNASSEQIQVSGQSSGKSGSDGEVFCTLLQSDLSSDNINEFSNQTKYNNQGLANLNDSPSSLENISDISQPLVLILHTHATECYSQSSTDRYEISEPTRTDDTSQNVVRIGQQIASTLSSFGIGVIHDTTLHDQKSFINAYSSSYKSAKDYLEKYPSLRFVIDVHRDAIIYDDNTKVKPTCEISGQKYAQLMFVVGTDESSGNHPNWKDNLSLSQTLRSSLMDMYPSICRKTNIRSASFNQQLSSGYLLLEVGSCGNTLSEALVSSDAFATVLAQTILKST